MGPLCLLIAAYSLIRLKKRLNCTSMLNVKFKIFFFFGSFAGKHSRRKDSPNNSIIVTAHLSSKKWVTWLILHVLFKEVSWVLKHWSHVIRTWDLYNSLSHAHRNFENRQTLPPPAKNKRKLNYHTTIMTIYFIFTFKNTHFV